MAFFLDHQCDDLFGIFILDHQCDDLRISDAYGEKVWHTYKKKQTEHNNLNW